MKKILFWFLALLITLASAVYQRMTGPTYPFRGKATLAGEEIRVRLPRSHESTGDCQVSVVTQNPEVSGYVLYRKYLADEPWLRLELVRSDGALTAFLPKQPPAGKLEYSVMLSDGTDELSLSGTNPIRVRFKGYVPASILIPHILIMFLAMLFSTRAGIAALDRRSRPGLLAIWATGLLFAGGIILGPLVQKFAFGAWWTGFPVGKDLTDTKTLFSLLFWAAALIAGRGGKPARIWVLFASLVTLAVYLIPHSLLGS
jgi:hypothetical protein